MLKHIKKYWIAYALLLIAIVALVAYNWETIKGWFTSEDLFDGTPRFTAEGRIMNPQGNERATCPINCLIETSTPGLYRCASPCKTA